MAGCLSLDKPFCSSAVVIVVNGPTIIIPVTLLQNTPPVTSTQLPVVAKPNGEGIGSKATTTKSSSALAPVGRSKNRYILPKPKEISSKLDAAVSEAFAGCSTDTQSGEKAALIAEQDVKKSKQVLMKGLLLKRPRKPQPQQIKPDLVALRYLARENFQPQCTSEDVLSEGMEVSCQKWLEETEDHNPPKLSSINEFIISTSPPSPAPQDSTTSSVFATSKGKSKRVRKSSPLFRTGRADTLAAYDELISITSPTKSAAATRAHGFYE